MLDPRTHNYITILCEGWSRTTRLISTVHPFSHSLFLFQLFRSLYTITILTHTAAFLTQHFRVVKIRGDDNNSSIIHVHKEIKKTLYGFCYALLYKSLISSVKKRVNNISRQRTVFYGSEVQHVTTRIKSSNTVKTWSVSLYSVFWLILTSPWVILMAQPVNWHHVQTYSGSLLTPVTCMYSSLHSRCHIAFI